LASSCPYSSRVSTFPVKRCHQCFASDLPSSVAAPLPPNLALPSGRRVVSGRCSALPLLPAPSHDVIHHRRFHASAKPSPNFPFRRPKQHSAGQPGYANLRKKKSGNLRTPFPKAWNGVGHMVMPNSAYPVMQGPFFGS